jgi:CHAT domain-containing protein
MKPWVIAAALAICCACGGSRERSLDDTWRAAQQALTRGRLSEAEQLITKGQAAAGTDTSSPWPWRFRLLAIDARLTRLDLPGAQQALASVSLPDGDGFAPLRARTRLLQAKVLVLQGQLGPAAAALDEARGLADGERELLFDIEIAASQVRYRTGKWTEAESGLQSLVRDAGAAADFHHQAQALNNLGMGMLVRSRYDEALPWFDRVLNTRELDGTTVFGQALNNAGICLARLGQYAQAIAAQERAISVHKDGSQLDYQRTLGELGTTYFLSNDVAKATQYWTEARRIATAAQLPSDALLWTRNLAEAAVIAADWDAAERYNNEASAMGRADSGSRRAFALLTSAQIAAGRGRADEATAKFTQALDASADVPAVRWASHDGLARLAAAAGEFRDATRHYEAALHTIEQTRSAILKADYRISFPARLITFYQGYVNALLQQGQVDRALEIADSSRSRVLAERQGVTAPAGATAAGFRALARASKSVLLFYWLAPGRSVVWVVTGDGVRSVPIAGDGDIATLVDQHQTALHDALADPLAAATGPGDTLYARLIAPVAASIPDGGSVIVVPDGALHRLNFETLTVGTGASRHYWIDDVTVRVAPSLSLLSRPKDGAAPASRAMLLVGDPTPRPPDFPALGNALAEMRAIAARFPSNAVTTISGTKATPEGFLAAGPARFGTIHFTSHAVANLENPLDSAVILSGPDQDFKLYARDVAELPLTADLVTVSACRSAGERSYTGEGLVGFAWAFLRAGSRNVVAGLWDVDDRSTTALMDTFYARLAAGDRPAAALRAAKLALIKQGFPKPYYWAPFQLFTTSI